MLNIHLKIEAKSTMNKIIGIPYILLGTRSEGLKSLYKAFSYDGFLLPYEV